MCLHSFDRMHVLPTPVHAHGQQMQEIGLFTCCQQSLDMSVTSKSRTQDFAIFDENWWRRSSWVSHWYDATSIMTNFDYHRWQAHACQRLCPYRTLIWGIVFHSPFTLYPPSSPHHHPMVFSLNQHGFWHELAFPLEIVFSVCRCSNHW